MLSIMNEIDPCLSLPLYVLYEIQNQIFQQDCATVTDVWAGSIPKLQKGALGFQDLLQLVEYLVDQLSTEEMELFWMQC